MITVDKSRRALIIQGHPPKADNLANYRQIKEAGISIHGPMTRYYHWYSRFEAPMLHQVLTADYVCRYRRGFILNDIGTGKTMIIYWLSEYLRQEDEINKVLLVAPLSTLEPVHAKALREHFPQLTFNILHGTARKRRKLLAEDKHIYIINFDGVGVIEQELSARPDINAVFIDEVAVLRNSRSKRWKIFDRLFGEQTGKMCWGLTGSPMPKEPPDCYGQILLVAPSSLPTRTLWNGRVTKPISFYQFRDRTMIPGWGKWEWKKRQGWETFIKQVMQPSIRFERDECCDLPDCVTEVRDVQLSKEQDTAYRGLINQLRADLASGEQITALNEGDKIRKLLQISVGSVYNADKTTTHLDCKSRFEEMYEIIDACKKSHILIFAPYKNIPSRIAAELNKHYCSDHDLVNNMNPVAQWITGDTHVSARNQYYEQFTKGNLRFIAATPHCMSHGLNLQDKCWAVIWWGPVEDYEVFEQANGRITRTGQKHKQIIFHLQGTAAERKVYSKLEDKESAQNILLEILKEG
jgi:SNF2 family DNA or RNA helicase